MSYITYDFKVGLQVPGKAGTRYVTVNAPYQNEAMEMAENIMGAGSRAITCQQLSRYNDGDCVSDGEGSSFSEVAIIGAIILGVWLFISFWKIILAVGILAFGYWIYTVIKD